MFLSVILSIALFLGLLGGLALGRQLGRRYRETGDATPGGSAAADGVVFAVLGLLIAFTFTASASRFDHRRELIILHTNALGTAWLRVDTLPTADQAPIRERMLEWTRLASQATHLRQDPARYETALADADRLQGEAWQLATAALERSGHPALTGFVLAPFNDWIDLTTTRRAQDTLGPPPMVVPTLVVLSLIGSVLAGFNMHRSSRRSTFHMLAFSLAIALSIYVILDLDDPRAGLITVESTDVTLRQLLDRFEQQMTGASMP